MWLYLKFIQTGTRVISISLTFQSLDIQKKIPTTSGGVHVLLLQDWMKSELLACLDWLSDTVKAKGQHGPPHNCFSSRVQNVQFQGEYMKQKAVKEKCVLQDLYDAMYKIFALQSTILNRHPYQFSDALLDCYCREKVTKEEYA